jgi:nucleoside-diphosphate-sugar epimerase
MRLLVTGGTGFIGRAFVEAIAPQLDVLYLLVRPNSLSKAREYFSHLPQIRFIEGDVFSADICHHAEDLQQLVQEVTSIIHLAAKYDLEMSVYDAYTNNVIGAQNMLTLARRLKKLEYFHHVSSYAINAYRNDLVLENDLSLKAPFNDHYSKSKMQSEYMFRTMDLGPVKKRIYRPGIVVGDQTSGLIEKVDGPYYFLRLLHKLKKTPLGHLPYLPLPYGPNTLFPIIPIDWVVQALVQGVLSPEPNKALECYHLLPERPIRLDEFVQITFNCFDLKFKLIRLKRLNQYKYALGPLGLPKELLFYMFSEATYCVQNRKQDFPGLLEVDLKSLVPVLVEGSERFFKQVELA